MSRITSPLYPLPADGTVVQPRLPEPGAGPNSNPI